MSKNGMVYIVGAGPGSADLITVKGRRCVRRADIILHDRLIDPELLLEARPNATIIDAGKRFGHEEQQQQEIHELMVAYARQGLTVCRLKGGDPFIFGRGGEEVAVLEAAAIPYEVVPGVSSLTAAPAMAGIALTHRDHTHGFLVIAGSRSLDFNSAEWAAARAFLKAGGTVVVLMGLARIQEICRNLLEGGCDANMPAVVVSRTTWPDQQVRHGSVSDIADKSRGLATPAILLFGRAAAKESKSL
jgi:uroporphyrin-III C-methyltransferase